MNGPHFLRLAILTALVTAGGCERGQIGVAAESAPDASPAASQSLPDWSGAWALDRGGSESTFVVLEKSLKPTSLAEYRGIFQKYYVSGQANIRESSCTPYMFGGFGLYEGFEGLIEFLATPGRVTLIWEGGLVRRIYTDGRALPEDPEPTTAVSSTGRWENQTLLVETKLNPDAAPLTGYSGTSAFRVGEHARLSERIFLKDPDTLQMDLVLDAPSAFTQPAKLTLLYRRVPGYYMSDYTRCPANDRSLDPHTGHPKFNLTPPADLPPPPD